MEVIWSIVALAVVDTSINGLKNLNFTELCL